MTSLDKIMIPVTISIVAAALVPLVAPDINWQELDTPKIFPNAAISQTPSQTNDDIYFKQFDNNVEDAKQTVRDLLAEHEAANP